MLYTVKATTGREDIVVDMIASRIRVDKLDIQSVFHPAEIKGYIFVEGAVPAIQKAIAGMMHVKGFLDRPVKIDEIRHFLEFKKEHIKVDIGDIVEIIGGPFKGEKGRIQRLSTNKDEVTVELLEASTPIPITIATEFVKVIKKEIKADSAASA
ncbi:MAG: transcription elongation factor Spt5 [Candidatus Aenigmarchaeota archaeon]|nr:transcription elongation factor Spt5 [Candidatus Aenigmarchaeota archaeon]